MGLNFDAGTVTDDGGNIGANGSGIGSAIGKFLRRLLPDDRDWCLIGTICQKSISNIAYRQALSYALA